MYRTFRWIRTSLVTFAAIGALAVAPGSALAMGDASLIVTGVGATTGEQRTYTATLTNDAAGGADPWTQGGTVTISSLNGTTISALAIDPASTMDATVVDGTTLRVEPGSVDTEELRFTFSERLRIPANGGTISVLQIDANSNDDGLEWGTIAADVVDVLPVGGPSIVIAQVGAVVPSSGVTDRWARLGASATSTLTVRNLGTGPARHVVVTTTAQGVARREYSPEGPAPATAFTPVVMLGTGTECVLAAPASTTCEIDTLPAGGAVHVPLSVGGIDHYGWITIAASIDSKGDLANPYVTSGWLGNDYYGQRPSEPIAVTDGSTAAAAVAMGGPSMAAGNTDLAYTTDIVNSGPDTVNNGIVRISATTFDTDGAEAGQPGLFGEAPAPKVVGDARLVQSLRRVELSTGVACTNSVQRIQDDAGAWKDVTLVDAWDCPVGAMPAGQRIAAKITANFATSRRTDLNTQGYAFGIVTTELLTTSYITSTLPFMPYLFFNTVGRNQAGDQISTALNATNTVDLDVSVTTPKTIGAQRLATQRVTIRNVGATPATMVSLIGAVTSRSGSIEPSRIANACVLGGTEVSLPPLRCFVGDLAAGAATSIDVPIIAGTSRDNVITAYTAMSREADSLNANNEATASMSVVAPAAVPLLGVGVPKPRLTPMAAFLKAGYATRIATPGPTSVRVDLKVSPAVAYALKLRSKRGVKGDLVIGSTTTRTTKAGTVIVTVKVRKQFVAKLRAATRRVAVKRTVTVVSSERFSAGARMTRTQTVTLTPRARRK